MFIVKDYNDLEKFVKEKTTGFSIYLHYDGKVSEVEFTEDNKLKFDVESLQKDLMPKKELYANMQYIFINKNNIEKSFSSQQIVTDKMTEEELDILKQSFNSSHSYSHKDLSGIVGLSIEQIAKTSCFSLEELKRDKFAFVEIVKVFDYPSPVRLLQYIRKHSNETEAIQMNGYILDCNEIINEYINDPKYQGQRRSLDGLILQIFQRVVEKVIDFQCLMHVRKLMDIFLIDYEHKNYMGCFKVERMILHSLEQNSKN